MRYTAIVIEDNKDARLVAAIYNNVRSWLAATFLLATCTVAIAMWTAPAHRLLAILGTLCWLGLLACTVALYFSSKKFAAKGAELDLIVLVPKLVFQRWWQLVGHVAPSRKDAYAHLSKQVELVTMIATSIRIKTRRGATRAKLIDYIDDQLGKCVHGYLR